MTEGSRDPLDLMQRGKESETPSRLYNQKSSSSNNQFMSSVRKDRSK